MRALVLDALIAGMLPVLAWRALASDDLAKSIVLFVSLGLVSAIAWARLDAPDIALVEAAVGAGITGALLLRTLRALGHEPVTPSAGRGTRLLLAMVVIGSAAALAVALVSLPAEAPGLGAQVRAALPESGVDHPVTAVLLDFRGYDTLLEVAVLTVAVLAVRSLGAGPALRDDATLPLLGVLVRLLVPGTVLVAGYLLWRGTNAPGGAFQAAAVLAGGGILAILAGTLRSPDPGARWVRGVLALGPGVFLAVAASPLLAGAQLLEYPDGWAGGLMLAIELVLTCSISLVLVMFFPGGAEPGGAGASGEPEGAPR